MLMLGAENACVFLSPSAAVFILSPCTAVMQRYMQGASVSPQGAVRASDNRAAASSTLRQAT